MILARDRTSRNFEYDVRGKLPLLVIIVLVSACPVFVSFQQGNDDLDRDFIEAFEAVERVDEIDSDVSYLVEELNQILGLIDGGGEADLAEAEARISAVKEMAESSLSIGEERVRNQLVESGLILGVTFLMAVLVWRYLPRLVWRFWLRSKRDWIIRP